MGRHRGKKEIPREEKWKAWDRTRKKRVEGAREVQAKKEIVGCTFKPKLNRKTEAMARQGRKKTSVDKRLYEDGMKKEMEKRGDTAKGRRDRDMQSKEVRVCEKRSDELRRRGWVPISSDAASNAMNTTPFATRFARRSGRRGSTASTAPSTPRSGGGSSGTQRTSRPSVRSEG